MATKNEESREQAEIQIREAASEVADLQYDLKVVASVMRIVTRQLACITGGAIGIAEPHTLAHALST